MFACLYTPDFPVQAALRLETNQNVLTSPVVLIDGPSSLQKVISLNKAARAYGLEVGMTKLQVETFSKTRIKKRSLENEDLAQAALLDCANEFSPRVESTSPGIVTLDLQGTEKLFGSLRETANKIKSRGRQFGFELNIGIASNPDTAFFASKGFDDITVIPPGREAESLGRLRVNLLPLSPETFATLTRWGIHNFQSFVALPSVELATRLGSEGLRVQNLAKGKTKRTLVPMEPKDDLIESYEFDDPVETIESINFILNRLIQQACGRLCSRSLATSELRLCFQLEVRQLENGQNKEFYEQTWKLPFPTQESRVLFRLITLDLEGVTFAAPIKKITIQVLTVKPRTIQGDLFSPPTPELEKVELALARIRGAVGKEDQNGIANVGVLVPIESYKPDSFTVAPFMTISKNKIADCMYRVPLKTFRPAVEASVKEMDQRPQSLSFARKTFKVLVAYGPWSSSGNWWDKEWSRDAWDVALSTFDGVGYYRIYFDLVLKQWFVQGLWD